MTIMSATFDSLGYFERLKDAGFTEKQAKVQTEAMREIVDDKLVTKGYLNVCLRELEYRLTIRMGAMIAGAVALLAAFITLAR